MDARRSVTLGGAAAGAAAVAACIAIAGTLTVSHAIALTDVAGEPVSASPVVVQAPVPTTASAAAQTGRSAESTSARTADPSPTPHVSEKGSARSAVRAERAEVVPAPKPRDVTEAPARVQLSGHATGTHMPRTSARGTHRSHGAHRTPAFAGHESGRYLPSSLAGSKKEKPRISPDQRGR